MRGQSLPVVRLQFDAHFSTMGLVGRLCVHAGNVIKPPYGRPNNSL